MSSASLAAILLFGGQALIPGPSSTDFARALTEFTGQPIDARLIRRLSCRGFEEEPTEMACRWQQKIDGKWHPFTTYVAIDRSGWHLIDEPYRKK